MNARLAMIILMLGPASGAHLNPVVSLADWWIGRRTGSGLRLARVGGYTAAQIVGAVLGIGAAYWFTASTSFANPAVTVGRMFSDTFAAIAPARPVVHRRPSRPARESRSPWRGGDVYALPQRSVP